MFMWPPTAERKDASGPELTQITEVIVNEVTLLP